MRSDDPASSNKCWQDVQRMEMTEIEILTLMASTVRRNYGGGARWRRQREKNVVSPYAREGGGLADGGGGGGPAAGAPRCAARPAFMWDPAPPLALVPS